MQARKSTTQEQDSGGKKLSKAGRDFFRQKMRDWRLSALDLHRRESVVEVSGCPIWVKTLRAASDLLWFSRDPEWSFGDRRLLIIVTGFRLEDAHPDAKIYAMSESEAKMLANRGSGKAIRKRDFRERIVNRHGRDEWRRKLRDIIGVDAVAGRESPAFDSQNNRA